LIGALAEQMNIDLATIGVNDDNQADNSRYSYILNGVDQRI